jgi:hypothetical protein
MISREDMIAQSLEARIRTGLFTDFNYPTDRVELIDAFDGAFFEEKYGENGLDKTYVAAAYQFDNGGTPLELGSSLTQYLHTVDFFCFGHTPTWGRNVAHMVKAALLTETGSIPLYDWSVPTDPRPIIDYLPVEEVTTERIVVADASPWNEHAWTTRVRVLDEVAAGVS